MTTKETTMDTNKKEILTVADLMKLLNISRSTIHRKRRSGDFVSYRIGKKIYFKRSEILATVEAGREEVEGTAVKEAA